MSALLLGIAALMALSAAALFWGALALSQSKNSPVPTSADEPLFFARYQPCADGDEENDARRKKA